MVRPLYTNDDILKKNQNRIRKRKSTLRHSKYSIPNICLILYKLHDQLKYTYSKSQNIVEME